MRLDSRFTVWISIIVVGKRFIVLVNTMLFGLLPYLCSVYVSYRNSALVTLFSAATKSGNKCKGNNDVEGFHLTYFTAKI